MSRAFIISPNYNARRYLKAHALSVAENVAYYPDTVHIIVDDYSTDGGWERLQQGDLKFPHLTVIRQEKNGGSAVGSFIKGVEYVAEHHSPTDEDVVFWLDGDDWLCDEKAVSKMMRYYNRNPELEMCYSDHVPWKGGLLTGQSFSHDLPHRTLVRYMHVAYSHLRSFRWKMLSLVQNERLLDETGNYWKFAGDSALFLPMLEVAKRVKYIKEPFVIYNMERGDNEYKKDSSEQKRCSVTIRNQPPNINSRPDVYTAEEFPPTLRFKADHGRICNIACKGCYYLHQKPWKNISLDQFEQMIRAGAQRGNRMCDISGGEPTIAKDLPQWIEICLRNGILPGIITHGQDVLTKLRDLWAAGLQDILFSVHGNQEAHNRWTQSEPRNGYARMFGALGACAAWGFKFRTNTVLSDNYKTLPEMARELTNVHPYISNFINFNPYYEWKGQDKPFMARVSDIAPYLKEAIDISVENGTMVNVRYFPFCALKGYEKHIVNMHQVMFDPYEWDYGVTPKTPERYAAYGRELAERTSAFTEKCLECGLMDTVCSGVNKVYLEEFGDAELDPYREVKADGAFHFRRHAEPGQLYHFLGHNFLWHEERRREDAERRGAGDNGRGESAEPVHRDTAPVPVHQHGVLSQP